MQPSWKPLGGPMTPPRTPSLQLLSLLKVNGLRGKQKLAALFAALQAGPWHVVALQQTHHAGQAEATQWCREGAGPTAPWDGPSVWASGTSASRGVALLFKASPLLLGTNPACFVFVVGYRGDVHPPTAKHR